MVKQARELQPVQNRLIIKLPEKPNIKPKEYIKVPIIDRRSLCSGRIHYKITLEVCLQDGQVLSLI